MEDKQKIQEEFKIPEEEAVVEYEGIAKILSLTYSLLAEEIFILAGSSKTKILDLGTGLGNLARELAIRYPEAEVIGLDISSEMLEKAEKSKDNLPNLKFMLMDVHNLDFSSDSIDLIASYGSLHHWNKPQRVFKEIYRVLNKGGFAFISDLRRDAPKEVIEEVFSLLSPLAGRAFLSSVKESYTPEEIDKMLKEIKLENFEIKPQKFSRQAILRNIDKIKNTSLRSERYNKLNLNILIKK